MKIKEALFKLNDFCNAKVIEYMVTGTTTALAMLGVPSNPQDIDVKVFHLKEEQEAKLKELQFLSGLENENYEEGKCYSFVIGGIKINAIVDKTESYDEIISKEVVLDIIDESHAKHHLIGIKYEYNKELMDKHGINTSNPKLSKIGAIMADAFEKEGVYSLISPGVEHRLARAVETAAKELVKIV